MGVSSSQMIIIIAGGCYYISDYLPSAAEEEETFKKKKRTPERRSSLQTSRVTKSAWLVGSFCSSSSQCYKPDTQKQSLPPSL